MKKDAGDSKEAFSSNLEIKNILKERRERVEKLMNTLFDNFLVPLNDINLKISLDAEDRKIISELRKKFPELLLEGNNEYLTLPLLIATITKILADEEMRFLSDNERNICGAKFIK